MLTPILTVSGPAARAALAAGARGVVAFSSNNVAIDPDAAVYAALRREEDALAAHATGWRLIRPTMIYGHPADGNLSVLLRRARRWPALPLAGSGKARQQPIHIDDLAALAGACALADGTGDAEDAPRMVTAAGPSIVTMRELYDAVGRAAGRSPPVAALPRRPLLFAAHAARGLGLAFPLSPAQVARAEMDKLPPADAVAPSGWRAEITLEDGLARLAAALDPAPPTA